MSVRSSNQRETNPEQAKQAAEDEDQSRFCSSCSRTKPVLGGALVRCANGAKRWKCADCRARSKAHQASQQGKSKQAGRDGN